MSNSIPTISRQHLYSQYSEHDFDLPGVHKATQKRSIEIRDAYIRAGIELLNSHTLVKLTIPELAKFTGKSVGSFYTRFSDKEAYFTCLQHAVLRHNRALTSHTLEPAKLANLTAQQCLELLVDLMVDIFTSPGRGVLREALVRISEPGDLWGPMRQSAQHIIATCHTNMAHKFAGISHQQACDNLSYSFQIIAGILQNDLINASHIYSAANNTIREPLKKTVLAYNAP